MNSSTCQALGIDKSWYSFFEDNSDLLQYIIDNIDGQVYPEKKNIFKVFSMPISDIKVVIMGQDPYPQGLATGIAFGVPKGEMSKSLQFIMDELVNYTGDILIDSTFDVTLQSWIDQGIFLINSSFSVKPFKIGSHYKYWHPFTENLIKYINNSLIGIIFVFMGGQARKFSSLVNLESHYLIETPHPNADLYSVKKYFTGCGVFKKIDDILYKLNGEKIKWI